MVEMEKGADLMQALVDSELQPSVVRRVKLSPPMPSLLTVKKQSDPEILLLKKRSSVWSFYLTCVAAKELLSDLLEIMH